MILITLQVSAATQRPVITSKIKNSVNIESSERNFLIRLGFEDFSAKAQSTIDEIDSQSLNVNTLVKPALAINVERYKMVTAARELAVLFRLAISKAEKNNELPVLLDRMTRLAAYHLMPFPLVGLEAFPKNEVYKFKRGDAALELREAYLIERAVDRFQKEASALAAALVQGLYGNDPSLYLNYNDQILKINQLVTDSIKYQYEFTGLQQSRYLGRALTATLLRYTRQKKLIGYESRLSSLLNLEGQFLSNHISSKLSFRDRKNKIMTYQVHNGDFAHEYSAGPEAFAISAGVHPKGSEKNKFANKNKLIGNSLFIPMLGFNPLVEFAQNRQKQNYNLSEQQENALNQVWDESNIQGFTHAGLSEIKTDKESGIEMVWIWDIYPYGNVGGVRVQTPENFAYAELYNRIGFVHYDSKKVLSHFQKNYSESGYKNTVWDSFATSADNPSSADPGVEINKSKRVARKNYLDQPTAQKWMTYSTTESADWFNNEVVPRTFGMIKKYLTGQEVLFFSNGFKNIEGAAYCSQFVLLAFLQAAQLDMQTENDQSISLTKALIKIGVLEVESNDRIVSPNGFAWQKDLVDQVFAVNLNRQVVDQQKANHPALNGLPTVSNQRLKLISDLLQIQIPGIQPVIDISEIDTDDDDL